MDLCDSRRRDRGIHRAAAQRSEPLCLRRSRRIHLAWHDSAHQFAGWTDFRRQVLVDAVLDRVPRAPARLFRRRLDGRLGFRFDRLLSAGLACLHRILDRRRGALRADRRAGGQASCDSSGMSDRSQNPETINAQTQRLAALGFMVAGVCHEVSNPLAAVHSMLQILQSKRGVTPEVMEKGLASISANVARVMAITRKLGDFSRAGDEPPTPVSVDAAMEDALALLRHSPYGVGVRVVY